MYSSFLADLQRVNLVGILGICQRQLMKNCEYGNSSLRAWPLPEAPEAQRSANVNFDMCEVNSEAPRSVGKNSFLAPRVIVSFVALFQKQMASYSIPKLL